MRVIWFIILLYAYVGAISYTVTPSSERRSVGADSGEYQGRFHPSVTPNKSYGFQGRSTQPNISSGSNRSTRTSQIPIRVQPAPQTQRSQRVAQALPVQITPAQGSSGYNQPIEYNVKPYNQPSQSPASPQVQVPIQVVPPIQEQRTQTPQLGVKVYPPTMGNTTRGSNNEIKVDVSRSRPITQEMMFYPESRPKMKIPPRQTKKPTTPPPQPVYQDQYDDEDSEPLFIRNRNGVMIGFGIGAAFDRLWVGGSGDNHRFYENNFTWYFRLGYQYYFTPYLGLRSYVHLGDWMDEINSSFWDGKKGVQTEIVATSNLNYSGYVELLYDFVVLENHSFGIFGGFGVGVGSYEFSNDGTGSVSDYFVMPMISAGFAYTLYLNNRFEMEVKAPLRQGVLDGVYRAEFSTWMLGFSYTYVF